MGKGYSKRLNGECITQWLDNKIEFFRTINGHILMYSPSYTLTPRNGGTYGCGPNRFYPNQPYIQEIPASYKYDTTSLVTAPLYGKSSDFAATTLRTYSTGEPVYFSQADYDKIKPRPYVPYQNPADIKYAQGPAVTCAHCFFSMERKLANENTYFGRYEHDFVDSIGYPRYEKEEMPKCDEGKGGYSKNWLSFAHPATFLYTSVPEPFKIKNYYEESGSVASINGNYGGNNFMPFCSPLNATNFDGSKNFGQYKGMTFVTIFGQNAITYPIKKYMPEDPYSTSPTPPKIDPTRAMYSIEIWTFWASNSPQLGSPLIGKVRFWFYSLAPYSQGTQTANWTQPFRILFASPGYNAASYSYRINCRVLGVNSVKPIVIDLSGLQAVVLY